MHHTRGRQIHAMGAASILERVQGTARKDVTVRGPEHILLRHQASR